MARKNYIVKTRSGPGNRWLTVKRFPMREVAERYIGRQPRPSQYTIFFGGKSIPFDRVDMGEAPNNGEV